MVFVTRSSWLVVRYALRESVYALMGFRKFTYEKESEFPGA